MPRFSIITPVFNPPREAFESCVQSVRNQSVGDWEWCLANDKSTADWVSVRLLELQIEDARIRVVERPTNGGIVAASNDAISIAQGEFLVLLDNDDELHQDALAHVGTEIDADPEVDYIYSDEDKLTPDGMRFDNFAKPIWSPERLLAQNYTSHLSVLRRSLVNEVGRFRHGFEGSQDYDLVLRVVERARTIRHVPHVLYHWRTLPTSTASSASAKPYAFVAAMKAVNEHLHRTKVAAEVIECGPSLARVQRKLDQNPLVSVVIATDWTTRRVFGVDTLLTTNVMVSLTKTTTYNNYEVILVVPPDSDPVLVDRVLALTEKPVRVAFGPKGFDLGQYQNVGLVMCRSEHALLIDQHCEFVEGNWIETLLGYSDREGVAAVAPLIVDEYGSILSAGIGFSPEPHHIGSGRHHTDLGPVGMFAIAREAFGVSSQCVLVDVAALKSVGGFSPEFATRLCEFDLAAKLHSVGLHAIISPIARVRSLNSGDDSTVELTKFSLRWGHLFGRDPYTRIDTRTTNAFVA